LRITWSPLALERVVEIVDWVAADRPGAARRLAEGIFQAVERLRDFPDSGRQVPEFDRPQLQEVFYGQYRVIYRVAGDEVSVLTVRHSLQSLDEADLEPDGGLTEA
jgi:toxin ParE1/3/4